MQRTTSGPWALVTGASSGIGYAFAEQLAKDGVNVVLTARSRGRLEEVSQKLRAEHSILTRVVPCDLSTRDSATKLSEDLHDLDIGLVVSNAGAGMMGEFLDQELRGLEAMAHLNVVAHLGVAHAFGRRLRDRGGGGLLLVSSTAGLQGVPYSANYAAAKAYILTLGEGLNAELESAGVNVSVTVPGPTSTPGFHERDDIDLSVMPMRPMAASAVAQGGLRALARGKVVYVPGVLNRVMAWLGRRVFSRRTNTRMFGLIMKRAVESARMKALPATSGS